MCIRDRAAPQRHDVGQVRSHARAAAAPLRVRYRRRRNRTPERAERRRLDFGAAASAVGQVAEIGGVYDLRGESAAENRDVERVVHRGGVPSAIKKKRKKKVGWLCSTFPNYSSWRGGGRGRA